VWHDAAAFDRELAAITQNARAARAAQFSAVIKQLRVATGLDPDVAAVALIAMIEEFTYRWLVEADGERTTSDALQAAHVLSELARRALGFDTRARTAKK